MFLLFARDIDIFCDHFVFDKKILSHTDGATLLVQILARSEIDSEQKEMLRFYFSEKFGNLSEDDLQKEFLLRIRQVHKDVFNAHKNSFGDSLE